MVVSVPCDGPPVTVYVRFAVAVWTSEPVRMMLVLDEPCTTITNCGSAIGGVFVVVGGSAMVKLLPATVVFSATVTVSGAPS